MPIHTMVSSWRSFSQTGSSRDRVNLSFATTYLLHMVFSKAMPRHKRAQIYAESESSAKLTGVPKLELGVPFEGTLFRGFKEKLEGQLQIVGSPKKDTNGNPQVKATSW